jgi:hypothetical protein
MSFGISAIAWLAIGTGVTAAVQYDQGQKAQGAQRDAQAQALKNATAQADAADQANNRSNMKKPNVQGLFDQNKAQAAGGVGGTMLTGPMGVDPIALTLGRKTLLGG